jgi:hypothetical protein
MTRKSKLNAAKKNVVQIHERLPDAMALANEHTATESNRSKVWYDGKARKHTFAPGQKVLVLFVTAPR